MPSRTPVLSASVALAAIVAVTLAASQAASPAPTQRRLAEGRQPLVQGSEPERRPGPLRRLATAGRRARGGPPLPDDARGEGRVDADRLVQRQLPERLRQSASHPISDPARQPRRPRAGAASERISGNRR